MNDLNKALLDIMNIGAGNMPTIPESIDEHLSREEYDEQRQAAKDTWVEGEFIEATKRQTMINLYLLENQADYEDFVMDVLEQEWEDKKSHAWK